MMVRILLIFLLAASIFSSCNGKSDLLKKVFCDEALVTEMEGIEKEVPEKFKEPALECLKKNSTKSKGVEVDCNGTNKKVPLQYAAMFEDSEVFLNCIMKVLAKAEKILSEEEKKKLDELLVKAKKIYDKVKKMEGGSSNSTNSGSGK